MKSKGKGRLLELGKDVLILGLLCSAVLLALRSQAYTVLTGNLLGSDGTRQEEPLSSRPRLEPLCMAVNLPGVGRWGVQYDSARLNEAYGQTFSVLSEALGTAEAPAAVSEEAWRQALSDNTGIYFDFRGQIPLSLLCAVLDVEGDPALVRGTARRVLVAERQDGVALYYYNEGDDLFYVCTTSEALHRLYEAASGYSANGALFTFETGRADGDPYVLLLQEELLRADCYLSANPLQRASEEDREELLEALDFRLQPGSTYRQEDRQVINEWPDALNILDSGWITYETSSTQDHRYPVGQGETATAAEAVEATWPLALSTVGSQKWGGEAALFLLSASPLPGGGWQVDYGCTLNGIPVQRPGEDWCARFTVREGRIASYSLYLRQYTATGETALLLPQLQAAAAWEAMGTPGELVLAYEDTGGEMSARWIGKQPGA